MNLGDESRWRSGVGSYIHDSIALKTDLDSRRSNWSVPSYRW